MIERHERLDDLLVQRATEGLDAGDTAILDGLISEHAEVDAEWVDRLLGELDAELLAGTEERLSPALRATVLGSAPAFAMDASAPAASSEADSESPERAPDIMPPRWSWAGWAVAAVMAALAFGPLLNSSGSAPGPLPEAPGPSPEEVATMPDSPGFAQVAALDDAVVTSWAAGPDATGAGASGEVVWSAARQEGVMRFRGLAANDPTDFQYQLWIFDAERDERFPVDGGVFDIPAGADEVEVPISARLPVGQATLFAVTVEEPGGVVVSTRERIATLAELGQE